MNMSKPSICAVHPVVGDLESAIALMAKSVSDYASADSWVQTLARSVDPSSWTKLIEGAHGDLEESEKLRLGFVEKSLSFMTGYLRQTLHRASYNDSRMGVLNAIRATIEVRDSIEERRGDSWLRPVLEGACVLADSEFKKHERSVHGFSTDDHDALVSRAEKIMFVVFKNLCEQIRLVVHDLSRLPEQPSLQIPPDANQPQRNVFVVPLNECPGLSLNFKLFQLLKQLEAAVKESSEGAKFLREENGRVNERQHANRLLDTLCANERPSCGPTDPKAAVEAQNRRRVTYECGRHVLLVRVRATKALYDQVVQLFLEAAAEAFAFCERIHTERQQNRGVVIDDIRAYRCAMNNLLAVERELRRVAPVMTEDTLLLRSDKSVGAGAPALATEFERVARVYRLVGLSDKPAA